MTSTWLTAAAAACLLLYYARSGHVAGSPQAPLETVRGCTDSPRTVTASVLSGLKTSVSPRSTPTILHLSTVQEQADRDPDLREFRRLMQDCGATFFLEQTRYMTTFLPTNEAVHALLPVDVHKLPWEVKWRILQYHIVPQEIVNVEEIPRGSSRTIKSWEGSLIKVQHKLQPGHNRIEEGKAHEIYVLNDVATIVSDPPRTENSNGASYKINRVLIPPELDMRTYEVEGFERRQQGVDVEQSQQSLTKSGSRPTTRHVECRSGGDGKSEGEEYSERLSGEIPYHKSSQEANQALGRPSVPVTGNAVDAPSFLQDINQQYARWSQDSYSNFLSRGFHHAGNSAKTNDIRNRIYTAAFTSRATQPSTDSAGTSSTLTSSSLQASTSPIKALALKSVPQLRSGVVQEETGDKFIAAGLLDPPEASASQNYVHQSSEPFLVGSGLHDDRGSPQTGATTNYLTHDPPLFTSSSQTPTVSDTSLLSSLLFHPAFKAPQRNMTVAQGNSLFDNSHVFQSYAASPSIAVLGLAEGLLPEEELVTHYWSKSQGFSSPTTITALLNLPRTSKSARFGPMSQLTELVNLARGL